jgi:hypothetical protein
MRTIAKRYPRKKDVAITLRTLQACIPMDRKPMGELRFSQSGAPNYRLSCTTNEKMWTVDLYSGQYYVVQVAGLTEIQNSLPSLVAFLCRMLKVQRLTQ